MALDHIRAVGATPTGDTYCLTDTHGHTFCGRCGLVEAQWPLKVCAQGRPNLTIVTPQEATELQKFAVDPLAWVEEWCKQNGKVEIDPTPMGDGYSVALWVEGWSIPISTGVAPTVLHAFRNAITGLQPFLR